MGFFAKEQRTVVTQIIKPPVQFSSLYLKVLGRDVIRHLHGLFTTVTENDFTKVSPGSKCIIAVEFRQACDELIHFSIHSIGEFAVGRHEPDR